MTNPSHAPTTMPRPAPISAEDILAVLTATPGNDPERLAAAVPVLAARLRAWEAAEDTAITELREQLQATTAEIGARAVATQRLQEEFDRLRRAVRVRVLQAIDDGTLYSLREEVDEALRDWGMPGPPTRYSVGLRVPFTLHLTASSPAEALARTPTRLWVAATHADGCQVHAYDADLDLPEPLPATTARGDVPEAATTYAVTGRAPVTVTLRARDPDQAVTRALPLAGQALSTSGEVTVDTEAITVTGVEDIGFDPDLDPDRD
jgi:hypothetical protein